MSSKRTQRTAHWGIIDSVIGSSVISIAGVITDWNESCQAQTQNELNELGTTIGRIQYDEKYDVSCTMQVKQDARNTFLGKAWNAANAARVTVGGKTYYVVSGEIVQSNKNFMRIQFRLSASRWVGREKQGDQDYNESQIV